MSPHDPHPREVIREEEWFILRRAVVEEVEVPIQSGGAAIRYRVEVWDPPREPFIRQMFNDPVAASDFLDNLKDQAVRNRR
jgi:hypothetical protein